MEPQIGSAFLCIVALVAACSGWPYEANARNAALRPQKTMIIEENKTKNEAAIRTLIDDNVKAIRAKDIDGVMSAYAPDLVAFDVVPPLQYVGAEAYRKPWQELFASYQSMIHYEVRDLSIAAGDDVAFSQSLARISGTLKSGKKTDLWLRWTACYRKTNGKWLIVNTHVSVPVDMEHSKAMLNLKP